jgi:RNA polymerase sigma-70 factor, ECF subfamily
LSGEPKSHPANESELVARIHAGDEQAMAAVYDVYSGVVYSVAFRVLQNATEAEDVLQDVFLQLWRNPSAFDSARGQLAPWLAAIARNRSIDLLRRRKPEDDISDYVIAAGPPHDQAVNSELMISRVRSTIDKMPAEQRKLLEMAYFEGLTHSEISARTGEPLGTVKTRIRSGLMLLRKQFGS